MFYMIWLFVLLSLFMAPAMYYYSQGTGIGTYQSWSQFSLGNFGYSTNKCQVSPFDLGSIPIKCQYGTLSSIVSAGVMPGNLPRKDLCNSELVAEKDQLCPVRADLGPTILSQALKNEDPERKGLFFFKFTSEQLYNVASLETVTEQCKSKLARIFVSYTCTQTPEAQAEKKNMVSVISCLGVLLVLIYLTVLHYFKRNSDLSKLKWDMQTVTPGDYTMQLEIT